jgi:phosphate transport system substrate-binding protein
MFKQSKLVSALAIAGVALFGAQAAQAQVIKIDGSSTVYPITEAVAEEFQKAKKNAIKVTVGISGTGGGFKKFCRDETDISNASRPITAKEMEDCKAAGVQYVEMPVAFDALTVVINPKNTFLKQITVAELKAMWEPAAQGKITKWNQVNPAWPDAPIKLFGAGADSGTFEYFTEATVGKAKSSRGDYTASEDDNVLVQGVSRDVNAIGYFGYAYYAENMARLKALPIVNPKTNQAVAPAEKPSSTAPTSRCRARSSSMSRSSRWTSRK